jgi:hypothetical protein
MDPNFVPTSKKLTWILTIFYILVCVAYVIIKFLYDKDISGVLVYLTPLEAIIIAAYFGKSGMEHYMEIKNSITNLPTVQINEATGYLI